MQILSTMEFSADCLYIGLFLNEWINTNCRFSAGLRDSGYVDVEGRGSGLDYVALR